MISTIFEGLKDLEPTKGLSRNDEVILGGERGVSQRWQKMTWGGWGVRKRDVIMQIPSVGPGFFRTFCFRENLEKHTVDLFSFYDKS